VRALLLALLATCGCEWVAGIDDREVFTSAGNGAAAGSAATGGAATGGAAGQGGASCSGGAPTFCPADPTPALIWPDSTPRCLGDGGSCLPGEDGDIVGVTPSYEQQGEIIVDQVTELQWQRVAALLNRNDAAGHCPSPWRLPTVLELLSLADYGRTENLLWPPFDLHTLPSQWAAEFGWSNRPYVLMYGDYVSFPWDLYAGEIAAVDPGLANSNARCVQGPERTAPLSVRPCCEPLLVRDPRTALEWQYEPSDQTFPWTAALHHCAQLTDHGGNWRLASVKELGTLYAPSAEPNVVAPFAPVGGAAAVFWTSTPSPTVPGEVLRVDFTATTAQQHTVRHALVESAYRAWCVRGYDPGAG